MKDESTHHELTTRPGSKGIAPGWAAFEKGLAEVLFGLEEHQYLIISSKRGEAYVQFAAQESFGLRAEAVSNNYLQESDRLRQDQIAALEELGWRRPTWKPRHRKTRQRRVGSPNFFRDFRAPVPCDEIARLAVRTLTEVHGITHPGSLEYEAFQPRRGDLPLPALGLTRRRPAPPPGEPPPGEADRIRGLVREALRNASGCSDLDFDEDGDLGLRFGSAIVFVRVLDEPPCVRVFSPVVAKMNADARPLARLNDLNATVRYARFFVLDDAILASLEVAVSPFVARQVVDSCWLFGHLVDDLGETLREQFGGHTAFGVSGSEPPASPRRRSREPGGRGGVSRGGRKRG